MFEQCLHQAVVGYSLYFKPEIYYTIMIIILYNTYRLLVQILKNKDIYFAETTKEG